MAFNAGDIEGTLTLDRSPFIRGLQQARADAERFERRRTTATVDADTQPATRRVGGLVGQLERVARKRTNAAVEVDVRGEEQLGFLRRQMSSLRDRDIEVRVHVDKAHDSIAALLRVLGSPMVAAVASIAAIAPAAVAAAGAIGGIGVAAMATLPAFGLLGAAMAMSFKRGGPSIVAFKRELAGLKGAFEFATGPATRAAFEGLGDLLGSIAPVVRSLRGEFTELGQQVGMSFAAIGEHLQGARMTQFFETSMRGAARAVAPLTGIFNNLLSVIANITEAGMPLFIRGLENLGEALGGIVGKTNDIDKLRAGMEKGARAAGQFWQIAKNLGDVLASVWRAGQQPSTDFLAAIERGTRGLADFFRSAEGQDILRKTLESMVFFAEELMEALPTLIEIFGELLDIGRFLWNVVKGIVDVVKEIPVIGPTAAAVFLGWAAFLGPIGLVRVALGGVLKMLKAIAGTRLAGSALAALGLGGRGGRGGGRGGPPGRTPGPAIVPAPINTRRATQDAKRAGTTAGRRGFIAGLVAAIAAGGATALRAVRRLVGRIGGVFRRRIPGLGAVAAMIAVAFKAAGPRVLRAVRGIPRRVGGLLKKIPGLGAIAGIIGTAFGKSKGKVDTAVKKVGPSAGRILKGAGKIAARGVFGWPGLIAAVIWSVLPGKLKDSIKKAAGAAFGAFKDAGRALMTAIGQGIAAAAGKVVDGVRWVIRRARSLLPSSEPKDTSSPLYGLGRSGAAIPENMAAGVRASTARLREAVVKMAEQAYAPTRAWAQHRLSVMDAMDKAAAGKPPTRAEQIGALQSRITQSRYVTDDRGVPIHARPPGVARVRTEEERELIRELDMLRQAFEREDLEATANLNINAMIPSDPRVLREIQRSLGRSVRQGRRRRPRKARVA